VRALVFTDEARDLDDLEVVRIDGTAIGDKDELLDAIAEGLGFPDWFGQNWDALEECLRDLEASGEGYALVITSATTLWAEHPRLAGTLVEVWIDAAERREARASAPIKLVFEW
jgi:RNAse (barnase) inhibitor barstar